MSRELNIAAFILVVSAAVVIAGCTGKNQPAPKTVVSKPKAPAAATTGTAKPEEKVEQEVYVYDARGRRDPFMSLVMVAKQRPNVKKKANPIENYDVSEIKLSAIVWDKKQYYALITLPDNKSYTIKKGMTLGLYGGRVQDITRDSVLIREQIKDYRGRLKTKDTLLKLRNEGVE
jgi:Tfp pilus assembly protein PilP